MTHLQQVVNVLTARGSFQLQPRLVVVDEVDFEFDAILRGPGESQGLVVVSDADSSQVPTAMSRIRALSHVMLRSGSIRSLALVMLRQIADIALLRELSSVCRVVQVKEGDEASLLSDLRSLLPLELPAPEAPQGDAARLLRDAIGDELPEPFITALLSAGKRDESIVEEAIINAVNSAIAEEVVKGNS